MGMGNAFTLRDDIFACVEVSLSRLLICIGRVTRIIKLAVSLDGY